MYPGKPAMVVGATETRNDTTIRRLTRTLDTLQDIMHNGARQVANPGNRIRRLAT